MQEKFLWTMSRNFAIIYEEIKLYRYTHTHTYTYIRVEGIRKENGVKAEVIATVWNFSVN